MASFDENEFVDLHPGGGVVTVPQRPHLECPKCNYNMRQRDIMRVTDCHHWTCGSCHTWAWCYQCGTANTRKIDVHIRDDTSGDDQSPLPVCPRCDFVCCDIVSSQCGHWTCIQCFNRGNGQGNNCHVCGVEKADTFITVILPYQPIRS